MTTKPNGNFQDLKTVKKVIKNVKAMKTLNTQKERERERQRKTKTLKFMTRKIKTL